MCNFDIIIFMDRKIFGKETIFAVLCELGDF